MGVDCVDNVFGLVDWIISEPDDDGDDGSWESFPEETSQQWGRIKGYTIFWWLLGFPKDTSSGDFSSLALLCDFGDFIPGLNLVSTSTVVNWEITKW